MKKYLFKIVFFCLLLESFFVGCGKKEAPSPDLKKMALFKVRQARLFPLPTHCPLSLDELHQPYWELQDATHQTDSHLAEEFVGVMFDTNWNSDPNHPHSPFLNCYYRSQGDKRNFTFSIEYLDQTAAAPYQALIKFQPSDSTHWNHPTNFQDPSVVYSDESDCNIDTHPPFAFLAPKPTSWCSFTLN